MGTNYELGGPPRFRHQKQGLNKLISTGGVCALLFDPGLGKTATVLDYTGLLALKTVPDRQGAQEVRVLVVCPLVAVDTWVIQAATFMSPMVNYWAEALGGSIAQRGEALASRGGYALSVPVGKGLRLGAPVRAAHVQRSLAWGARGDGRESLITLGEGPDGLGVVKPRVVLIVINIDTLASRAARGRHTMADYMVESIRRFGPHLLIVDEGHKIKSAGGNASRLLGRVSKFVPRRVLLTGTVMPHGPLDIYGQWRFLAPYAFGDKLLDGSVRQATYSSFKQRFAIMGGYMGHEVIGYKNLDDMQDTMSLHSLVARKKDALDLPEMIDVVVPVHFDLVEKKAYADMKKDLAATLALGITATVPNKLSQMMRLRQITAGFVPDDQGVIRIIGTSKVKTIKSLVHDTLVGEKRIVIFAFFTLEIQLLEQALTQSDTEIMVVTGGTSQRDRVKMRQRFGSDNKQRIVMIAQIKTMSLAVNELVTANHAIFATLSQQRDDIVQARDRLHRIGQNRPCTFWYALVPHTVDEVVYQSYLDKSNLEAAMLKHIFDQD